MGDGGRDALEGLLASAHLALPDDVPALIAEHASAFGAHGAVLHLVDLDQRWLIAVVDPDDPSDRAEVLVDGTDAGRCYRLLEVVETRSAKGAVTMWVPVVDGTERLGVLELAFRPGVDVDAEKIRAYAGLVAELVMTKSAYGDFFEFARRRRPMTVESELAWQLLPPLTFGSEQLVVTAAFVPTYDLGGDAFDYGVDRRVARIALFDAMGHGLIAGLLATTAVAAFRNGRRHGLDLPAMMELIDATVGDHFGPDRFVTGVVAELDVTTGRLRLAIAGHPPPLLLRGGHVAKTLEPEVGVPFGLGARSEVAEEQLEPGDRLVLFTDGVTEARTAGGRFFGVDRLTQLLATAPVEGEPPPETMRRLMNSILDHAEHMQDDATVVMVEWRGHGGDQLKV